jgi:hypothetical protein
MCITESPQHQECRRLAEREPVVLAGSAYALARSRSVIISDLSSEGAQLDGRDLPLPGEDLLVVVGSVDTFAKVVWRTNDKAGVHFDGALPAETIAQIKKDAAWETVAGWWR